MTQVLILLKKHDANFNRNVFCKISQVYPTINCMTVFLYMEKA